MAFAKKKLLPAVAVVATAGVLVALLGAVRSNTNAAEPVESGKLFVQTQQPTMGDIARTGEFVGKIEPAQEVVIYPKVSGEVLSTHFKVGDTVKKGDVLMEVDSSNMQLTLKQTQAAISSAESKLQYSLKMAEKSLTTYEANLEDGFNPQLVAAEAGVKTAENGLMQINNQLSILKRKLRDLRDDESFYEEYTYDEIETQYKDSIRDLELKQEAGKLGLQQAEQSLNALQKQLQDQQSAYQDNVDLAKLNADISDQQIALQQLRKALGDYSISAPIDGVIDQRNVDAFDLISPQVPVYTISSKSSMLVTFNVSANVAQNLQPGDKVVVEGNGSTLNGFVMEVDSKVNAVGLFQVKAEIPDGGASLMSGVVVTVTADTQSVKNAVILPLKSVYFKDGEAYVYTLENGKAVRTPIEVGMMNEEMAEVVSGIGTETKVISSWSPKLRDGILAEPVQGDAASANSASEESTSPENTAESATE